MLKKTVFISLALDSLFHQLFGQSYRINCSSNSHAITYLKWKEYLTKVTKNIKTAINKNVNTDGFHRSSIDLALKVMEDSFKEKEIETKYIEGLLKLVFLLLGDIPDNGDKKIVNKDCYFVLKKYRNLVYIQSKTQKSYTIIEANRWDPDLNKNIRKEIEDHYYYRDKLRGEYEDFLDYYKEKFPERYSKLF